MEQFKKLYPKTFELMQCYMGDFNSDFIARKKSLNRSVINEILKTIYLEDKEHLYSAEQSFQELTILAFQGVPLKSEWLTQFFCKYYSDKLSDIYKSAHDERYAERMSQDFHQYKQEVINSIY